LAALGCLLLVFRFADRRWGRWVALWSTLILATSVEFFLLARLVIIEMSLTLFITLALCAFYSAVHTEDGRTRRLQCLMMYLALSAGTLNKGLIGLIIPGMVCFFYLLITRKWSALSKLYPLAGTLGCLLLVAPWYLWAEARNPGYLRYYFWDEHFVRYLTDSSINPKAGITSEVLALGLRPGRALSYCRAPPLAQSRRWKCILGSLGGIAPGLFFGFVFTTAPLHIADFPGASGPDGSDDRGALPRRHDRRQEVVSLSTLGSHSGGHPVHCIASVLAGTLFRGAAEKISRWRFFPGAVG
jgi:4-amino-4-deoxy-L-arabinose transferase-like glycosyltransferase